MRSCSGPFGGGIIKFAVYCPWTTLPNHKRDLKEEMKGLPKREHTHTHTHIHIESVPAKGDAPHIPPNCLFQAEADCGKLYPLHFPCVPPHPLPFFFFVSAHMHTCQTTKCTVCDLICTSGYAWLLPCVSMMCVWVLKVCKYIHPVSNLFAWPFYLHVILHTWFFWASFPFFEAYLRVQAISTFPQMSCAHYRQTKKRCIELRCQHACKCMFQTGQIWLPGVVVGLAGNGVFVAKWLQWFG